MTAAGDDLVLTNIGQIRALSPAQVALNPRVRLEAVVTHYTSVRSRLWVQDEYDGLALLIGKRQFPVEFGDRVRVTGRLSPVENPACVKPDEVVVLGKSKRPDTPIRTAEQLNTFQSESHRSVEENRLVCAEGHVLQAQELSIRWLLELESEANRFWLELPKRTNDSIPPLMDATVRARGVCVTLPYRGGEKLQPTLLLQSFSELTVLRPGRPFVQVVRSQIPVRTITSLSSEEGVTTDDMEVHLQGTVLDQRVGESLVLRDDTGTISAETAQVTAVNLQQRVDLWGTPAWDGTRVYLKDAAFRIEAASTPQTQAAVAANKPAQLPVLTNALQVRNLSPEQAAWKYPVRLRAVVTLCLPERALKFYVQDETSGIYVRPQTGATLKTGDLVEIAGVSDPGGFAPCVVPSNITVIGTAPLPEAARATLYQLATGQYNSQWMEVRGVIRSQTYENGLLQLKLSDASGTFFIYVAADHEPTNLVDAAVRIEGVCGTKFNQRRQITGSSVWAPSLNYVQIEEPGVLDPLSLPEQPVLSLSQFRPKEILPRRVKVVGVVTLCQSPQSFFLQDASDAIQILTTQTNLVKPGDRVTVAGYPALGDCSPVLRDAVLRVQTHGSLPEPKCVPVEHILDPDMDDTWVQVDARLLSLNQIGREQAFTLQSGRCLFEARCPAPTTNSKTLATGSLLRLTGVYRVLADEARVPTAFQLLMPSRNHIQVLEQPSWWTFRHSLAIVGVVMGALALIVTLTGLWIVALQRKVGEQTASLQQSELKFRSLVEQSLVGVYIIQDERFAYVNPRIAEIYGYTPEEMIQSLTVQEAVFDEDWPLVQEQIRRRTAGDPSPAHYSFRGRRKDGSLVYVEVLGSQTEYRGSPAVLGTLLDITERKRAEDELFKSRQMLRTVLDTIPTRVFWKDRNLVYVGCNKALAQDCGYSDPGKLVGKTDYDTVSAANAELYRADDRQVMETGQPKLSYEEPQLRPDGSTGWLMTSKVPLHDKEGRVIGVLGTYEDITERKRAQAALADASALLETLLDHSPDHIYFKDRQSRFVRCSKAFEELFHVSDLNRVLGKTDFDFFSEEHARPAYEDEQAIMRTGQPLVGKLEEETHADGRITWCLTTKLPWRDNNGNIIGTFGISKDVTALKEAEDKLAHEREMFHTLVDNIPDAIYFKDLQSRFVRISTSKVEKALEMVLTRHRAAAPPNRAEELPSYLTSVERLGEYLMGKTDFDIYPEARARSAYEDEQEIIHTGQPVIDKSERTMLPDGKVSWVLTTKMPWRNKNGNIIGTFGVSRDITALKEAEAQLEAAHQRLIETSRLAGMAEVASDVLHNVGNVLNSVNVSCSLVMDRVKESKLSNLARVSALLEKNRTRLNEFLTSDPQGKQIPEYLTAVAEYFADEQAFALRELEQLLKHIDHIKQIVAMQQSYAKVAGVAETVTVPQLVDDALQINAAALNRHDVQVRCQFDDSPPILTERHKVLQILVNLIRNAKYALDATQQTERLLTIKVGNDGDGHVKLQVIDTGVGIPPENLTRIFAHGFTTRRNGHGFGLHSSALAARELGGSLHAQSEGEGKGATFTLLLPHKPTTHPV